jgi:diacylglycerol kinase (ATP)
MDGERWQGRVTQVDLGNGPAYGGGLRICPDADLGDGRLDVAIVAPLSRTRLALLKPKLPSGKLAEHPRIQRRRATTVLLDIEGAVGYADGERIGPLPLEVESVPGALRVLSASEPPAP